MLSLWESSPSSTYERIFHVAMAVRSEPASRLNPVLVDDTECPETHVPRVVVVGEGKCVEGPEPAVIGQAAFSSASDLHAGTISLDPGLRQLVVPHRRARRPRGIKAVRNYASEASPPKAAGERSRSEPRGSRPPFPSGFRSSKPGSAPRRCCLRWSNTSIRRSDRWSGPPWLRRVARQPRVFRHRGASDVDVGRVHDDRVLGDELVPVGDARA